MNTSHSTSRTVTLDQLIRLPAASRKAFYRPVAHHEIVTACLEVLGGASIEVQSTRFLTYRNDGRFLGLLDLKSTSAFQTVVCLINSQDTTFAQEVCLGLRSVASGNIVACEHLFKKKHTKTAVDVFTDSMTKLPEMLTTWTDAFANCNPWLASNVHPHTADSILLRLYEKKTISEYVLRPALMRLRSLQKYGRHDGLSFLDAVQRILNRGIKTNPVKRLREITDVWFAVRLVLARVNG